MTTRGWPLLLALLCSFQLAACAVDSPKSESSDTHKVPDKKLFATFDSGLRIDRNDVFWIDKYLLITSVVRDSRALDFNNDSGTDIVLVDVDKRQLTVLVKNSVIDGYDRETRTLRYRPNGERKHYYGQFLSDGREFRPVEPLPELLESDLIEDLLIYTGRIRLGTSARDGYLIEHFPADQTPAEALGQLRDQDRGIPTVWLRPDKPPLPLELRFDEILYGHPRYLEFLHQWLLISVDMSSVSQDKFRAGRNWHRPYEYVPLRLMDGQGQISEMPYPTFLFDYGLAKYGNAATNNGWNFGSLTLTKAGTIITKPRERGDEMFLYSAGTLHQIAGGSALNGLPPGDGVELLEPSPTGCKLAYGHRRWDGPHNAVGAAQYLAVMRLCN